MLIPVHTLNARRKEFISWNPRRKAKGTKVYDIPREHQHTQAHKAHLDFDGVRLPAWDELDMDEEET